MLPIELIMILDDNLAAFKWLHPVCKYVWKLLKYCIVDPKPREILEDLGLGYTASLIIGTIIGTWATVLIIMSQILNIFDQRYNNITLAVSIISLILTRMGTVHSEIKSNRNHRQLMESIDKEHQRANEERQRANEERADASARHKELIDRMNAIYAMSEGDQSDAAAEYKKSITDQCRKELSLEMTRVFTSAFNSSIETIVETTTDAKISKLDVMDRYDLLDAERKLGSMEMD